MGAAEAIRSSSDAARAKGTDETPLHDTDHAPEGPGRVNGEEDVVQDDKDEEGACFANAPGLLVARLVVLVEQLGRDGIKSGNRQRNSSIQSRHIEIIWDVEGPQNSGRDMCRRDWRRRVGRREVEEVGFGPRGPDLEFGHGECRDATCQVKETVQVLYRRMSNLLW